ncbi:Hypothetical protein SRAE_2000094200 [Strongyloides ratti]|uniref:Uncharacterized protein n=1 Tax=Strongyloides ratti TaxID=34506 RepID=A0A090L961_STRRB|nr:Hypothetical protein SRAE_2000094200 [Strongyloides ratti]CEF66272.1 Hypothetical protein SRAE_2000094200 [Strongyloides ratti]
MSIKLILAFVAAVVAIASANGPIGYGYGLGLGHYGFNSLPYTGYLGLGRYGYSGYPGFNKFAYGQSYPGIAASPFTYSPYFAGHSVAGYGYPQFVKPFGYGLPYARYGFGNYGTPVVASSTAASGSAIAF